MVLFCFKKYLLSSLSLGFGSSGRALLKKRTTLSHLYFAPGHWAALNSLSNGQQSADFTCNNQHDELVFRHSKLLVKVYQYEYI